MTTIQSTLTPDPNMPGTFLFDSIVFGPVISRRLGVSLGVNLLPANRKVCSFNCIYCECGFTPATLENGMLPSHEEVVKEIEKALIEHKIGNKTIDSITLAGNGEPTLHPHFPQIIESLLVLRRKYFPQSRIAVLTNATRLHKPTILNALSLIDDPVLKLDSAIDSTVKAMDCPVESFKIKNVVDIMAKMNSNFVLQTMFIRANLNGQIIDNTTDVEVKAWLTVLKKIKPRLVQIYTVSRIPASGNVEKVNLATLESIAQKVQKLGIQTQVTP
jgi:wyosine [tRNA(Phe)-imidazoG37] synthetase (radical SAM superfamily)